MTLVRNCLSSEAGSVVSSISLGACRALKMRVNSASASSAAFASWKSRMIDFASARFASIGRPSFFFASISAGVRSVQRT